MVLLHTGAEINVNSSLYIYSKIDQTPQGIPIMTTLTGELRAFIIKGVIMYSNPLVALGSVVFISGPGQ